MALFDALLDLFDNQTISNTDKTSTVIDFGGSGREMGAGEPLWLVVKTGTAFAGGTSLVLTLYSHTASTGLTGGTALYAITIGQTALTAFGADSYLIRMPLPYDVDVNQYVALHVNQSGTFSTGTLDAWIDHGPQSDFDTQVTTSNI